MNLQPCGTMAAYKRHKKRGEPVDDACRVASRQNYQARYRETKCGKPAYYLRTRKEPEPPRTVECPVCGESFETENALRVYCSTLCRMRRPGAGSRGVRRAPGVILGFLSGEGVPPHRLGAEHSLDCDDLERGGRWVYCPRCRDFMGWTAPDALECAVCSIVVTLP
jgi:hypothetical protein